MSRSKLITSLVVLLVLGGMCIYLNRDLFAKPGIHIYHRINNRTAAPGQRGGSGTMVFGFDRPYSLTSIKVFSIPEMQTNKWAHPLWELMSESNSIPVRGFQYGATLKGMHPKIQGAQPEPLQPGIKYRLIVRNPKIEAEHEFELPAANQ
jgi:hypothetical protein